MTKTTLLNTTLCAAGALFGCSTSGDGDIAADGGNQGDASDGDGDGGPEGDGGLISETSCSDINVSDVFPDATDTGECTSEAGLRIANTMMDLTGVTIDNSGEEMTPCMRIECDNDYAYIVSNNIPHYDFVVLTPNPLAEALSVHRIPLAPSAPLGTDAVDFSTLNGCETAYETYVTGEAVPTAEPSGLCGEGYLTDGTSNYGKLACLSQFAVMNSGVMANGPNEGDRGVWGDPGVEPFNELAEGPGASVDYCGGHTGMSMHYHAALEACFEMDDSRKPTLSYAKIATNWDQLGLLTNDCTEPSGIVGWSFDGYPIKGPCICVEQADDGSCATVKRARSPWMYRGLSAHAAGDPDPSLAVEGQACTAREDCCEETPCDFTCTPVVTDGDQAGSGIEQLCTLARYAWCTREYVDFEGQELSGQNFAYLDRCNGYDGPDGFAYHAVSTFPYLQACYRGEPAEQAAAAGGGGPPEGGGPPGGM